MEREPQPPLAQRDRYAYALGSLEQSVKMYLRDIITKDQLRLALEQVQHIIETGRRNANGK